MTGVVLFLMANVNFYGSDTLNASSVICQTPRIPINSSIWCLMSSSSRMCFAHVSYDSIQSYGLKSKIFGYTWSNFMANGQFSWQIWNSSYFWIKITSGQLTLLITAWLHMAVPTDRWSLKLLIFLCFTFSTKKCMSFFLLLFFHSFTLSQWWDPSQFWESRPPWCVPPSPPRPGACDPIWGVMCSIHVVYRVSQRKNDE